MTPVLHRKNLLYHGPLFSKFGTGSVEHGGWQLIYHVPAGGSIDRRAAFPLQRSERSLSHLTNGQRVVHRQLINGVQYSGADQSVILIMQALRPYPDQNPVYVCVCVGGGGGGVQYFLINIFVTF